jgi:hypothetical protein
MEEDVGKTPNAKVLFQNTEADGTPYAETLWSYELGADLYRIENLPYYAYGVSLHDVVLAPRDATAGTPVFSRVTSKSGNRLFRIICSTIEIRRKKADLLLQRLSMAGCEHERANRRYVAVNVPASTDLSKVVQILTEAGVDWEQADPPLEYFDLPTKIGWLQNTQSWFTKRFLRH